MSNRLELEFQQHLILIDKLKLSLNKHLRIRVDQWVKKLKQKVSLDVWKKNRNTYAYLLLKCLENNKLVPPFNKMPVEGSLPQMKQHENQQLNIIKHDNYSIICHAKFIKDARQRSEARQIKSVESKNSEKIVPILKNPININNYYSQVEKITKETSANGSRIHQSKHNQNNELLERVSNFIKKYSQCYQNDAEYHKIVELIRKCIKGGEQTPAVHTTFRGDDTELKVIDHSEFQYDQSYFASSRSEEKEEEEEE